MRNQLSRPRHSSIAMLLGVPLLWAMPTGLVADASGPEVTSEEKVAEQAKVVWESGAMNPALDILEQGIQDHPDALTLHKLRGDILATFRGPQEAIEAYETALTGTPAALDVRWAKLSVLIRSGQGEESIAELWRMALVDAKNPLIHLRLAQELRKLNRLEESLESYKQAVELVPELLGWRLAMARARFDVLDYQGAEGDVQYVLNKIAPGSPLELPAKNLLSVIYGESQERGRRFDPVLTPKEVTEAQLKEWALIRADAWRMFVAGRYQEAEPIYRKLLALNPNDPSATHQLGLTLMQLGRCKDALDVFGTIANLDPSDEQYADTVFRMGQCLVELEQWEDAFVHFQTLYDAAIAFEEANKGIDLPPDTRVLDKSKMVRWLEKIRPHIPELAEQTVAPSAHSAASAGPSASAVDSPDEEQMAKAAERLKPQKGLDARTSLMGRDADFSAFRFVIPAGKVMRDDFPTGAHEFIPLNPGDSFPTTQPEIYLVFGLVSASYDAIPLTAQCFLETAEMAGEPRAITQDRVTMSMSDQSGYFMLSRPASGWTPGLYRCGLFEGERTSAYTQADEVRFRIVEPARPS
ncbi:MAG TPA: tetratricopeptide repeat protein [Nitrospira sp.]|nr:tetratricopeptide repeat protein [Nitrospira sp.]